MALPPFGYSWAEQAARVLLILAGGVVLTLSVTGMVPIAWTDGGRSWLLFQSFLVIIGGFGAFVRSFSLAAVGVGAGLFFATPVGVLTFLPALWMLVLIVVRRRAFREFAPRWSSCGPPSPGHWR